MKIIFVIPFVTFYTVSYCQDSLSNIIVNNICNCLNYKKNQGSLIYNDAVNCVNVEMKNQSELFESEVILKYGNDFTKDQVIKFSKELGLNVSLKLIDLCPSYKELMDTARYSLYSYLNRDSLMKEITKLNSTDTISRNFNFYIKRAKMLFWISKFKEAEEDADQILKTDSTNELGLHIIAINLEINHKYDSALKIYNSLYKNSGNGRYAIDAALVKQKMKK